MENVKRSVQSPEDQQQNGIQNQGRSSKAGMQSPGKVHMQDQGTVAGSTGSGNQGKTGNPVSGK